MNQLPYMTSFVACQEDTCYNEFGLCAQKIDIILSSMVNIIGRALKAWPP